MSVLRTSEDSESFRKFGAAPENFYLFVFKWRSVPRTFMRLEKILCFRKLARKKDANNRLVKQKRLIAPTTKADRAILEKLYYELFS